MGKIVTLISLILLHLYLTGPVTAEEIARTEIEGGWKLVRIEKQGKIISGDNVQFNILGFVHGRYGYGSEMPVGFSPEPINYGTYKLKKGSKYGELDFESQSVTPAIRLGIYEIKGDTLRLCLEPGGRSRPTEFTPDFGISVWKKIKN